LQATFLTQVGREKEAKSILKAGLKKYPDYRSFIYGLAENYIEDDESLKAIRLLENYKIKFSQDPNLYLFISKAYSSQGKTLLQYENMAESFYYKFNLQEAINQMDLAVKANDGNFYEKSRVEARLKQLKNEEALYAKFYDK
jgi:predicted Zn-dependent protease